MKSISLVFLAVFLSACSADQPGANLASVTATTVEPSKQTFALGSQLTASGAVTDESTGETFARGGEVFLSIDVTGASVSQQVAVLWLDAADNVLAREQQLVGDGVRYVAFKTRPPSEGHYKAVVVIDGRRVSELPFAVI